MTTCILYGPLTPNHYSRATRFVSTGWTSTGQVAEAIKLGHITKPGDYVIQVSGEAALVKVVEEQVTKLVVAST